MADNISESAPNVTDEEVNKAADIPAEPSGEINTVEQPAEAVSGEQKEDNIQAQYKELYDKYLRLAAEYDNYRKRTMKEKADLLKYGGETLLKNILPVVDDWDRALKTIDQAQDLEAIRQGIQLINNKFNEFLSQNGVKEIEASEKDFNVDLHEAVSKIPSDDKKGKILDVLQKGFMLYDKVLRYSKVVVGE